MIKLSDILKQYDKELWAGLRAYATQPIKLRPNDKLSLRYIRTSVWGGNVVTYLLEYNEHKLRLSLPSEDTLLPLYLLYTNKEAPIPHTTIKQAFEDELKRTLHRHYGERIHNAIVSLVLENNVIHDDLCVFHKTQRFESTPYSNSCSYVIKNKLFVRIIGWKG